MKKIILIVFALLVFVGCSTSSENATIKVGVSPVPHAEIFEFIKEDFEKKGYDLEIIEFTDYVLPNLALEEGDLDANFFQHLPYLENFNEERKTDLVSVGGVHIEPIGLYSDKLSSFDGLEDGSLVVIPGDATNGGRSLFLLEKLGLISLDQSKGINVTPQDITDNPKNLTFKEMEAAQIPGVLQDADLATINTNYALGAGLDPKDALAQEEGKDNPYANILAVKRGKEKEAFVADLLEVLQSEKVKNFLDETYGGSILPAF